jgi:hypothetical protein
MGEKLRDPGLYSFNPCHGREGDCVRRSANTQLLIVIPDLIRNPVLFDRFRNWMPDQVRHDKRATFALVYPLKIPRLLFSRLEAAPTSACRFFF